MSNQKRHEGKGGKGDKGRDNGTGWVTAWDAPSPQGTKTSGQAGGSGTTKTGEEVTSGHGTTPPKKGWGDRMAGIEENPSSEEEDGESGKASKASAGGGAEE